MIHPNDNRLKDFDVKCPQFIYDKYDVGKRVVFDRVNIYDKLKEQEQRWYNEPNLCAIFSICFFYVAFFIRYSFVSIFLNLDSSCVKLMLKQEEFLVIWIFIANFAPKKKQYNY